jgi:hypothetical protein
MCLNTFGEFIKSGRDGYGEMSILMSPDKPTDDEPAMAAAL